MVGGGEEAAKVTEVSREFTVEVLPGISEMRTLMGEGRDGLATPELAVAWSSSRSQAFVAVFTCV